MKNYSRLGKIYKTRTKLFHPLYRTPYMNDSTIKKSGAYGELTS